MSILTLQPEILIGVAVSAALQSVFGVGVLLFGTPIMMFFGYALSDILPILLPVSIGISLSQIARDYRHVDTRLLGRILLYSLPFIMMFLVIALHAGASLGLWVAVLLFLYAVKNLYAPLDAVLNRLAGFEKSWLIATGIVHGLTNLGGSMLSIIVHQKGYSKSVARATIAAAYTGFAGIQLLTLLLSGDRSAQELAYSGRYVPIGLTVYVIVNIAIYRRLDTYVYRRVFSAFLFFSSLLVVYKYL